jgi:hypothetical protein
MARPRTYVQLNRLAEIAKKRETAITAAKLTATPKPYVAKGASTIMCFESIESDDLYVQIPVINTTWAKISASAAAIGALTPVAAAALAGANVVGFKGNHKEVLRVRIDEPKTVPTIKVTAWGTRVVDKIDDSYQFPMGVVGATNSLNSAKAQFQSLMTGALAALVLKAGSTAQLIHRGETIATYRKPGV